MKPTNNFKYFLLLIIVLTMYNNLEHSANIYYQLIQNNGYSALYNHIQSYLVVIVIDLSVIAFIVRARHRESKAFAWMLFVVNVLFFDVLGTSYKWLVEPQTAQKLTYFNHLVGQLMFSGIFSYTIHRFSMLYYNSSSDTEDLDQLKAENKRFRNEVEQNSQSKKQLTAALESLAISNKELIDIKKHSENHLSELQTRLEHFRNELTCPRCRVFAAESIQSLNAHKGTCKKK